MKLKIYLAFTMLFLTLSAMKCDHKVLSPVCQLSDIDVENLYDVDEVLYRAGASVKANLYTLGIKYIGKDDKEHPYLYFYQDSVINQKIYCNTPFDAKYPAGTDITRFFAFYPNKEYNGAKFKLKRIPSAGLHSFKVCIYFKDGSMIEKDTPPIQFY